MGERAYGETLSIAFAGKGQHQDTGAKMVHLAPNTTSKVTSKSVSRLRWTFNLSWNASCCKRCNWCKVYCSL